MLTVRPLIADRLKTISCSPSLSFFLSYFWQDGNSIRRFSGAITRTAAPMPSSLGKTVGSVSAGMLDFIPLYLESWRAYWQEATVGTRPQRHVIVILFFPLSWTPFLAVLAFLRLSNAAAFLLSHSLSILRPSPSILAAGSCCQSCRAVCSPHDAHSSLLSSFALWVSLLFF